MDTIGIEYQQTQTSHMASCIKGLLSNSVKTALPPVASATGWVRICVSVVWN